jgi:hypothetical protein
MHGLYWRISLPAAILVLLHITAWEVLATAVSILVFAGYTDEGTLLATKSDALLTAFVVAKQGSGSAVVEFIIHWMLKSGTYQRAARRLTAQHLSGHGNSHADLVSRGLWSDFFALCSQMGVRSQPVPLTAEAWRLVRDTIEFARLRSSGAPSMLAHTLAEEPAPRDDGSDGGSIASDATEWAPSSPPQSPLSSPCSSPTGPASIEQVQPLPQPYEGEAAEVIQFMVSRFQPPWATCAAPASASAASVASTMVAAAAASAPSRARNSFQPPWAPSRLSSPAQALSAVPETRPSSAAPPTPPVSSSSFQPPWVSAGQSQVSEPAQPPTERSLRGVVDRSRGRAERARFNPYQRRMDRGAADHGATLRAEEADRVEALVDRLANDRSAGRIGAPRAELREMAMAVAEAENDGVNPRTASKDELAWREWKLFAELRNVDPDLRSEWTHEFPEREALKLSGFLLFTQARMQPRSKADAAAKPMSVYQRLLALRRVFGRRGVELPSSTAVRGALRGLLRHFIRKYGIESLRPKRVEPVSPEMCQRVRDLPTNAQIGSLCWDMQNAACFVVYCLFIVNFFVGFRKGELTSYPVTSTSLTGSRAPRSLGALAVSACLILRTLSLTA